MPSEIGLGASGRAAGGERRPRISLVGCAVEESGGGGTSLSATSRVSAAFGDFELVAGNSLSSLGVSVLTTDAAFCLGGLTRPFALRPASGLVCGLAETVMRVDDSTESGSLAAAFSWTWTVGLPADSTLSACFHIQINSDRADNASRTIETMLAATVQCSRVVRVENQPGCSPSSKSRISSSSSLAGVAGLTPGRLTTRWGGVAGA